MEIPVLRFALGGGLSITVPAGAEEDGWFPRLEAEIVVCYKFVDDEGVESHVVGVILHYVFDFAVPD